MPDSFELPRMLRAIVPLVGPRNALVDELVPDSFPRVSPVIGTLDHLPEPSARLRCIEPILINRRAFKMIDFPTCEVRSTDLPLLTLAVGGQNEGTLACPY